MSYRDVYEKWLSSSALSEAEKEELRSISGDEKEIESRFFAPLEFGTAGLRGTMCVGLHQMNITSSATPPRPSPRSFWPRAPRR